MDKQTLNRIVDISKDIVLHHKDVLNWYSDKGRVHLEGDFFVKQFFANEFTETLGYEWFNEAKTKLEVTVVYRGVTFFALLDVNTVLSNLVCIKKYGDTF